MNALQKPSNCKLMSSKLISLYTFFSTLALSHRWLSSSTAPRECHQKSGGVEVCEKPLIVLEKLCSFSAPDFVPLILSISLETLKKLLFHSSSRCYFYHFLIDTSSTEHPWNSFLACCYCCLCLCTHSHFSIAARAPRNIIELLRRRRRKLESVRNSVLSLINFFSLLFREFLFSFHSYKILLLLNGAAS